MPDVMFNGEAGRIEGKLHPSTEKHAPIAIVLHPAPQFGGTMNNQIVYQIYHVLAKRNYATLRFNFRGVGRSDGIFDHGAGEVADAAAALDWMQQMNPTARSTLVVGFSFGAWIGMQVLMRRPEVKGFISISPPANIYDFSFLAPCPSPGLIVNGLHDAVVPARVVDTLVTTLRAQKAVIEHATIPNANHFFDGEIEALVNAISDYLDGLA